MNIENTEIAALLQRVADLLEIQDANPFRVRAYRNAARTVEASGKPIRDLVAAGEDLSELPAIGQDLAQQITGLVKTGKLARLEELEKAVPPSLAELTHIGGLGPKRAQRLWKELGIETVDGLEKAARAGKLAALEGFGEKSEAKILKGIEELRAHRARTRLSDADAIVGPLVQYLEDFKGVKSVDVAGSFRRRRATVGDLDLLAIAAKPAAVIRHFTKYRRVKDVDLAGDTRATVRLDSGLQVDLRVLEPASYGAALLYFTGSKAHNVKLRSRAIDAGYRLSEYGLFRVKKGAKKPKGDVTSGTRVAGKTEEEVYAKLELPWIPPELREDRGEIEAAARRKLPHLITVDNLRGDLQMHTTWSDGQNSLDEMITACAERGYEYCAITDHSKALAMTGGMDARALARQQRELAGVVERHPEIHVFRSMEIDILKDGSLDLTDAGIETLDIVLVAIHSHFDLSAAQQTKRILKAVTSGKVHILAHPTGRLINRREPYPFDVEAVLHAAKEYGVAVEINAHPERLDLDDVHAMRARELGVTLVIDTDAHSTSDLDLIHYGVEQARRAWVEPKDVLNALPLDALIRRLGGKRPKAPSGIRSKRR